MPIVQPVRFSSGTLTLEGALTWPDGPAVQGAVICHPHPQYGGDMDNNVVRAIERVLLRRSRVCLRFNYRGVGESEGSYGHGAGELDDALAALDFLQAQPGLADLSVGLAGFSFGARTALHAALRRTDLAFLILVAPALGIAVPSLAGLRGPVLLAGGGRDAFVSEQALQALYEKLPDPRQLEIVSHADHFWFGREKLLEQIIERFVETQLGA